MARPYECWQVKEVGCGGVAIRPVGVVDRGIRCRREFASEIKWVNTDDFRLVVEHSDVVGDELGQNFIRS